MTRRGRCGLGVKGLFGVAGVFAAMWLAASPPPAPAQRAYGLLLRGHGSGQGDRKVRYFSES